jgi:hypothetical protein
MENNNIMTAEEVKDLLGYHNVRTVYAAAKDGRLPGFKPRGINRWFFRRDKIYAMIGLDNA